MKLVFLTSTLLLLLVSTATTCAQNLQGCIDPADYDPSKDYFPDKVVAKESLFWDIQYFNSYKILRNELDGESFVLYQCGTPPPTDLSVIPEHVIPVPLLDGIALSSTTHIPHLELLGLRTEIKAYMGTDEYISSPCVKSLIADGEITVVKDTSDTAAVNAVKTLYGENIVSFHNSRTAYQSSLFNVTLAAYFEAGNEAIFEWNKFFAVFFNLEKKSNDIFDTTSERYDCYAEEAINIVDVVDGGVNPTIMWAAYIDYGGVAGWQVAKCPNYFCEYAEKCSADLITTRAGTIDFYGDLLLTTEDFVVFAKDIEHWIYAASDWATVYPKFQDQLNTIASIKAQQVWDNQGAGPTAWYENRLAEYDLVLQDFCHVVGTSDPLHLPVWFRNVFFAEPNKYAVNTCADVDAPLVTRATPCRKVIFLPGGFTCFSERNTVELQDGSRIAMKDLQIGQHVSVGGAKYSRVYSFGHYQKDVEASYLQISSKSLTTPLEMSSDHMVFVNENTAVPAGTLKIGDNLFLGNGQESEKITTIRTVHRNGAYAPFTESGTIVVNGAVASSYVSMQPASGDMVIGGVKSMISHQWMAHLAQAPHRLYCSVISTACDTETYTAEGLSAWINAPFKASQWLFAQNNAMVQIAVFVPTFCLLLAIGALEALVASSVSWMTTLTLIAGLFYYYFVVKSKKAI